MDGKVLEDHRLHWQSRGITWAKSLDILEGSRSLFISLVKLWWHPVMSLQMIQCETYRLNLDVHQLPKILHNLSLASWKNVICFRSLGCFDKNIQNNISNKCIEHHPTITILSTLSSFNWLTQIHLDFWDLQQTFDVFPPDNSWMLPGDEREVTELFQQIQAASLEYQVNHIGFIGSVDSSIKTIVFCRPSSEEKKHKRFRFMLIFLRITYAEVGLPTPKVWRALSSFGG